MAILKRHIFFYREIFKLPNVISEPFLMVGYQAISGDNLPKDFSYKDFKQLLISKGIKNITVIDKFDSRADLKHDLNLPIPEDEYEKYNTVFDIGSLEHVFDTKQCLDNCMRMLKPNGFYFLHTPVKGYFNHGLHTFSPELIIQSFKLNKFKIQYERYSSNDGVPLKHPNDAADSLIWIIGKKKESMKIFQIPEQECWYQGCQPKNTQTSQNAT
ncbi:MAG: class I SAM-dependent methyltransferase [Candidatus Omnitrophota bacterium]|nr:MAG: class I SAM-dependent methyltransferase [Candidatus Omnitrophota bacterium]